MAESQTTKDFIAGWIGGVAGIIVSNPLDVLKIRLQTSSSSSLDPRRTLIPVAFSHSPSFIHHGHTAFANLALQYSIPPNTLSCVTSASPKDWPIQNKVSSVTSTFSNLKVLWRQEGYRFLFAGAAAPILGLAFIDSFFFATYGKCMSIFNQDRERPSNLNHVFASGATAGGVCALLQTPIEVIKCRAQAEHFNQLTGAKAGSFVIAKKIYQRDGLRGFYLGGLMTGLRDSLSSGIFFTSYALIRRNLQDFYCFASHDSYSTSSKSAPEIFQLMFAGGMSGVISALLPYPLDIVC
ncbi:hypothetical protein O181_108730 [Austropuccinia psidii MF-1]|uniref:Mitochondrial carrier protein n=1 Tax=Austropuccinia psidii MF-1 TaxID=1389203 RepID=A0A9Q3PPV3_9BASI|nr:hypothetical protein [Austropuccinia psidii MF-1]